MYGQEENYENLEAREKAKAEAEAIANGESFNPYIDSEKAAVFDSLGDVPFAGDQPAAEAPAASDIALTAAEVAIEGPEAAAAGIAVDAGLSLAGEMLQGDGGQTPTDMAEGNEKHNSMNPISQEFDERWDNNQPIELDDIKTSVDNEFPEDAAKWAAANPDIEADIADANRNTLDGQSGDKANTDQLHDITEAATVKIVSSDALSEDLGAKIENGDTEATAQIATIEQQLQEAENLADKIDVATINNSETEDDRIKSQLAADAAVQIHEKAAEIRDELEEKQNAFEIKSDEEKAISQAAVEAAEENGTTIEEEKAKAEAEAAEEAEESYRGFWEQ